MSERQFRATKTRYAVNLVARSSKLGTILLSAIIGNCLVCFFLIYFRADQTLLA